MMKLSTCLFLAVITVFACKSKKASTLLSKEQMINMITEVSLAEAYAETYVLKDSSLKKDSVLRSELQRVYQVNKITPETFAESYKYYSSNTILFKQIIDSAYTRAYRNKDRIYLSTSAN